MQLAGLFVDIDHQCRVERHDPAHILGELLERIAQVDDGGDGRRQIAEDLDARSSFGRLAVECRAIQRELEVFRCLREQCLRLAERWIAGSDCDESQ